MQSPDFWTKPERFEILSRIALMDRVRAAAGTAEALRARLAKAPSRGGKSSKELIARLALQLHLTGEGIKDAFEEAPVETAITVETALDGGAENGDALDWRAAIAGHVSWLGGGPEHADFRGSGAGRGRSHSVDQRFWGSSRA